LNETSFTADYAVVCELAGDSFVAAHMGQATVAIEISRPGMPTHELQTPTGTPHPLMAAGKVISAIEERTAELAATEHALVGAETYFLGELHGGDFYNRFPTTCRLVGTRRWQPGKTLAEVEEELRALLAPIAADTGCAIELDLKLVRDSYRIDPEEKLAVALRAAYRDVTGVEQPLIGIKVVADGAVFHQAGIPTVYHGPMGSGAHADVETMEVAELVRATRVYLALLERLWA
jgi:acetylornithine deacetylase/succinyl-diaminopimelate desuccinylase-like protein